MAAAGRDAEARDTDWAEPVEMGGVPNLHRVTANIYRGAQPTGEGFRNLEAMGIRTVVNLRSFHHDNLYGLSMAYVRVRMEAWDPEMGEIARVMRVLSDESGGPYFVHCQHGADRTGMAMAVYRMVVQGWSKDEAIEEMTGGGYGFHSVWLEIPAFLRNLDVESVRKAMRK
jgi:protein tyrosine/serine phosphatase